MRQKPVIVLKDPPGGRFREVRFYSRPGAASEQQLLTLEEEARRIVSEYGLVPKKEPKKSAPALRWFLAGLGTEALTFLLVGLLLALFTR